MEIADLIKVLSDNGIGLVCVGYLIYNQLHVSKVQEETAKEQSAALKEISEILIKMNERINNLELCKIKSEK